MKDISESLKSEKYSGGFFRWKFKDPKAETHSCNMTPPVGFKKYEVSWYLIAKNEISRFQSKTGGIVWYHVNLKIMRFFK